MWEQGVYPAQPQRSRSAESSRSVSFTLPNQRAETKLGRVVTERGDRSVVGCDRERACTSLFIKKGTQIPIYTV